MTQEIKDKIDTDGAEHLVGIGYPKNKEHLPELIFWSCFANDPVCWITHPYIRTLEDDVLAEALEKFMQFHLNNDQEQLVQIACADFVYDGRENLVPLMLNLTDCQKVKDWLSR